MLAILLSVVHQARPAQAQNNKATLLLAKASRWYKELHYERVLDAIKTLETIPEKTTSQLKRILELKAFALSALGRNASREYRFLLCLDPSFAPDPSVSPRMLRDYYRQKRTKPVPLRIRLIFPRRVVRDTRIIFKLVLQDTCRLVSRFDLFYRHKGRRAFRHVSVLTKGRTSITMPISTANTPTSSTGSVLEWYATIRGMHHTVLQSIGSPDRPRHILVVQRADLPVDLAKTIIPATSLSHSTSPARHWYEKWWIWTIAGVVVGSAATLGVLLNRASNRDTVDLRVRVVSMP